MPTWEPTMAEAPQGNGALLQIRDLHAFYGDSHVLHGVDLEVSTGEVVTLMGRNGAGRTTILKAILGIAGRKTGSILFQGREVIESEPHEIARLGIGYCPEDRGIFASLSVEENLTLPPRVRAGGMTLDEIYAMFPNLEERRRSPGSRISGGEQQMLALARILRTGAHLLLLDEVTEGLAPVLVRKLGRVLAALKAKGLTILLVEHNFPFVAPLADRHYVIDHGRVVEMIPKEKLESNKAKLHDYLGV